jgi:hypothetical protein
MDEQPVPKRTLGPSRLRHEIRQESTDDDRATDHIELQVFDSDIVIPETQPKHSPNANDGDDFLLSPKSKAMLAKNAISKSKSATGMDPMEVTLLSKEPLSGTSLEHSQRTFTFSPYTTSRKSPSDEHPSKKTSPDPMDVKSAVDLPTEIAQKGQCSQI